MQQEESETILVAASMMMAKTKTNTASSIYKRLSRLSGRRAFFGLCASALLAGTIRDLRMESKFLQATTIQTSSLHNLADISVTNTQNEPPQQQQQHMEPVSPSITTEADKKKVEEQPQQPLEEAQPQKPETAPSETAANKHQKRIPKFIFGHSTGHAGSTTVHRALGRSDCPWNAVARFEQIIWTNETGLGPQREWPLDEDCIITRELLLPFLEEKRTMPNEDGSVKDDPNQQRTFIDIGHFHNRGRTIECLADLLQDEGVAFVKVRRNRYDIANSFASAFKHSCMHADKGAPVVSLCPHSSEVESGAGSVNLPVTDDIWDNNMTTLQRFLWYADEMEHRWHTLQKREYKEGSRPDFYEITWSTPDELKSGFDTLLQDLGCAPTNHIPNAKKHVKHREGQRNCASFIQQDLEYRRLMQYNKSTLDILFQNPQPVDSAECRETREELVQAIRRYSGNDAAAADLNNWVLPASQAVKSEQ